MKRLPIQAAKDLANKYDQNQVILVTWDKNDGLVHVVSYGKTKVDCSQAAIGANLIKTALEFPEKMCHDVPARGRKTLPPTDYRVTFEGAVPLDCIRIPPGQSYGKRQYGDVIVVVVQARTLEGAVKAAQEAL